MLPQFQVDRGAVKFILSGANIMCRGLTSPGAKLDMSVDKDKIVAIMVEGKEDAIGVGLTKMSAKEMYVVEYLSLKSNGNFFIITVQFYV